MRTGIDDDHLTYLDAGRTAAEEGVVWVALHGRTAELTRTTMLYCLFRHAASHVLRDVAVRAGQRFVVQQMSSAAFRSAIGSISAAVTRRIAGASASRWLPLAGAAAVAGYAYWDTLQVAKSARTLLGQTLDTHRRERVASD
jgi:hypothetical protein